MGVCFKLNLRRVNPFQSPFLPTSAFCPSSYSSSRGRDNSYDSGRVSFALVISWQRENLYNDPLKAHKCSSAQQTLEKDDSEMEGVKMNTGEDKMSFLTSLQSSKPSRFGLLMENLDTLEATFADSDKGRLERDILLQLERLGALNLFHICLSRTLKSPTFFDSADTPAHLINPLPMVDVHIGQVIVRSKKKEERKSRRGRVSQKASVLSLPLKSSQNDFQWSDSSSAKRPSNSRSKRLKIARSEAEMSRGVKLVHDLEKIKTLLEGETGQVASLSRWAKAAGVDEKVLLQQLHFGWWCRDELLRSARSLVVYLASNYRGRGVALEDIIQAGSFGVLQGAVRFDHNRGCRFSTYVQYWIRKSISTFVERHSSGIRVPPSLSKAMNQIQKARKALKSSNGRFPSDVEIAKFTGLSAAKITAASQCIRVVGSIDQEIGDFSSAKFMEFTRDTSTKSPEEVVMRQYMRKEINDLLNTLNHRERQVLVQRFGLGGHRCKSLQEIGKQFCVSKVWIRRMERTALEKLRVEESCRNLRHYLNYL